MNTVQDDNEQMEYLRQRRLKKEQKIELRKEGHCVLLEKAKVLFGLKKRHERT